MALSDFFRINLPYGLKKNDQDEWFAFNREYKPVGWNVTDIVNEEELPVYTKYKGLSEKFILKAIPESKYIHRDENGVINRVFFYDDKTNPQSNTKYWAQYYEIIKAFSKLEVAK